MTEEQLAQLCAQSEPKMEKLRGLIAESGAVLVAFSGGVDSTFLLKVAHDVLGERCLGLLARSPSLPDRELANARELARSIGARLHEVQSRELEDPRYVANPIDRCYFCKSELFELCERTRAELGFAVVYDGFNADDRRDWRPGHKAARERSVRSPLAEAGLTKDEIRAWSHRFGLPTWDKPAMACLASRLPYGTPVTAERLGQVGGAEQDLWDLGLRQFRVRHHGDVARLEVGAAEYERVLDADVRRAISERLKARGFKFVALDLEPFRSGRMNEAVIPARATSR